MLLLLFVTLGGLLLMMGHQPRSESLFYYFRIEDQVPENHLLRLIDRHVSFDFVREKLKGLYSDTGRPSIDPELLLRMLLVGYLYGVSSERRLVEELRMHWPGAGSLDWDSIKRFHTTQPSPRIAMDASKNQVCFSNCSKRSWHGACKPDW